MPTIVFSRTTGVTHWEGRRIQLAQDDPWNAEDPFVRAHPEHFASRPLRIFGAAGLDVDVEQATAAPGEKRTTRRAK